jgi:hypothetical protein
MIDEWKRGRGRSTRDELGKMIDEGKSGRGRGRSTRGELGEMIDEGKMI